MVILCFGEPLIRLSTVAHERLDNARSVEISYGGAEVVVATTLAQLGQNVAFMSVIPENRLGTNAIMNLARYGIGTSKILRSNHRMGLYYSERGRSIRPTVVTYDRSDTSMANAKRASFDWDHILNGIEVFFFSGVVPAISDEMFHVCIDALRACKGRGIKTVIDLNYRETMWSHEDALLKIGKLMPLIDELIASEDDIISIEHASVEEPELFDFCLNWAHGMLNDYSLRSLCFVVRQIDRYDIALIRGAKVTREKTFLSLPQQVSLADISSCGSVFAAAILHGEASRWESQFLVDFATMSSAFKATVLGDLSNATETEIASLLASGVKPSIRQ
ncbi:sugar kinase [Olsenella massiliensis]|uniref:sugar kinase n=1 Tax=Olsenella massiliensis TaxID=1622075 RepID=UPI00071CA37E|nr:sugar kinase [Olsenella massiliensis]